MMNRKRPWEGYRRKAKRRLARCLLPAFLCAHIFIERETSGYEAVPVTSEEATGLHDAPSQRDKEHILERQNHKVILEKADLPPIADILIHMNLRWLGHVERVDFARLPRQLLYS